MLASTCEGAHRAAHARFHVKDLGIIVESDEDVDTRMHSFDTDQGNENRAFMAMKSKVGRALRYELSEGSDSILIEDSDEGPPEAWLNSDDEGTGDWEMATQEKATPQHGRAPAHERGHAAPRSKAAPSPITIDVAGSKDSVFSFGRHYGKTYLQVLQEPPDYYFWGAQQANPSLVLRSFLTWVRREYDIDEDELLLMPKVQYQELYDIGLFQAAANAVGLEKIKTNQRVNPPNSSFIGESLRPQISARSHRGANILTVLDQTHQYHAGRVLNAARCIPGNVKRIHARTRGSASTSTTSLPDRVDLYIG